MSLEGTSWQANIGWVSASYLPVECGTDILEFGDWESETNFVWKMMWIWIHRILAKGQILSICKFDNTYIGTIRFPTDRLG